MVTQSLTNSSDFLSLAPPGKALDGNQPRSATFLRNFSRASTFKRSGVKAVAGILTPDVSGSHGLMEYAIRIAGA